jgi:hypothetical protein
MKSITLRGLAFDVVIEEFEVRDLHGRALCYIASIYRQDRASNVRQLLRRSRLPETVEVFRREVDRDGIQAFRRLAA